MSNSRPPWSWNRGGNRIAVYARNHYTESGPELLVVTRKDPEPRPTPKPNLYLLAIGVSDYGEGGLTDLSYADDDARAMRRVLKTQEGGLYGTVETRVLTDGEARRSDVLKGLKWLRNKSTQHDVSVIFVAGHGMNDEYKEYYFLPGNADAGEPDLDGVKWLEFHNTVERLPGIRWLLVDTCHAGNVTGVGERGRGLRSVDSDITDALRALKGAAGSVVIMSAATGQEASLESGNGATGIPRATGRLPRRSSRDWRGRCSRMPHPGAGASVSRNWISM
uniref:Caspase domain-containing protein n=1 Tax=Candidatus Kentrum sp. LFY TaxID=2126342 RepID=A0A450UB38_9GAMM|nr:MAG: Caspase domain-containing protein [Candidatus Kentron sp. LFY]